MNEEKQSWVGRVVSPIPKPLRPWLVCGVIVGAGVHGIYYGVHKPNRPKLDTPLSIQYAEKKDHYIELIGSYLNTLGNGGAEPIALLCALAMSDVLFYTDGKDVSDTSEIDRITIQLGDWQPEGFADSAKEMIKILRTQATLPENEERRFGMLLNTGFGMVDMGPLVSSFKADRNAMALEVYSGGMHLYDFIDGMVTMARTPQDQGRER